MEWLYSHKIPVGDWASAVFEWIRWNLESPLDTLSIAIENID